MTETAAAGNDVKIEDAGPSRKKLSITVPADQVAEKIEASLNMLVTQAQLPGFRPGRAPRRLIERKFGGAVRDEAKTQIIAEAYQAAVEQHELKVLGEPETSGLEDLEIKDGEALSFEVEVEVLPEFDLPELEGIEVLRPEIGVKDEQVEDEVQKILINEGSLEERDTPEPGDYVSGHGVMTGSDGTEHHNIEGAVVQIPKPEDAPKGMILGIVVDDLTKQLGLPKPGETATIKATGPEHHEIESVRGDDLKITFKVERIDRIIPATIESVLERSQIESEDALREFVKNQLDQRAESEQRTLMRRQISRHLAEKAELELPERLTENQAARNLERARLDLMYRGLDSAEVERQVAEMRSDSLEGARRELKLYFVLNKAAEELGVQVDESEINGQIARIAMQRGERPEKLRQDMIQQNRIPHLFQQLREHKTMDAILDKASVKDVSLEEFEKAFSE